jgi:hypothetical protein
MLDDGDGNVAIVTGWSTGIEANIERAFAHEASRVGTVATLTTAEGRELHIPHARCTRRLPRFEAEAVAS